MYLYIYVLYFILYLSYILYCSLGFKCVNKVVIIMVTYWLLFKDYLSSVLASQLCPIRHTSANLMSFSVATSNVFLLASAFLSSHARTARRFRTAGLSCVQWGRVNGRVRVNRQGWRLIAQYNAIFMIPSYTCSQHTLSIGWRVVLVLGCTVPCD